MIRGIRRRFMRIAIGVLALAMVLVAVIINGANWVNVRSELYETLGFLEEMQAQKGAMGPGPRGDLPTRRGNPSRHLRNMANESRFFSVTVGDDGSCALGDTTHVSEEDADSLVELATRALAGGRTSGFWGDYLFRVNGQSGERVALFLNCETKLTRVRLLALISAVACAGCVLLAWLLVGLFSSRAIRPLVESAIQQKQFITDAGHELKTPLTVISANMDVLTLETGENEWIRSTQKQVANLRGLVGELIYLSRLDRQDAECRCGGRRAYDWRRGDAGPTGIHTVRQRREVRPGGRYHRRDPGPQPEGDHADYGQCRAAAHVRRDPAPPVRPLLPGGCLPQPRERRLRHRPVGGSGDRRKARRQHPGPPDPGGPCAVRMYAGEIILKNRVGMPTRFFSITE